MPGPAPKDGPKHGRYTSPLDDKRTEVAVPGHTTPAPELVVLGDDGYLGATHAWYSTWASAPQASLFTSTDWQRLQMLAPMVDRYYRAVVDPKAKLYALIPMLAEIRQNEALLGATHVDRLRGRIKVSVEDGPAGPNADVAILAEYRDMLAANG